MPEFYPRVEVRLDRETREKLEALKRHLRSQGGKGVSTSSVCARIISEFLEKGGVVEGG